MRQLRQYNQSGEIFACDTESMTMSQMLHYSETDAPLGEYNLDLDMEQDDIDNSRVIREEGM